MPKMMRGKTTIRTTVTLDPELLADVREYSKATGTSALLRETMVRFVQSEASQRLAKMGGTCPDLTAPPRRRFESEKGAAHSRRVKRSK